MGRSKRLKISIVGGVELLPNASVDQIGTSIERIQRLCSDPGVKPLLSLVARIDLMAGKLTVKLNDAKVAALTEVDPSDIETNALTLVAPFQLRKRGVESKLVFADAPRDQDEVLIRNLAKARHWFEQIKSGKTFAEIANAEATSKRRIQQMIELAFLAPDIVRDVLTGRQPVGLTSDWCLRHTIPSDWSEQRALIATL